MHIGYSIGCYGNESYVFSIPITISPEKIEDILRRGKFPINGSPLTREELEILSEEIPNDIEIGWDDTLNFFLEGMNMPDNNT